MIFLDIGYDNLDGNAYKKEKKLEFIKLKRHIFKNNTNKDFLFIFCLVEFGCELLIPHYLLPKICSTNKNKQIVVVGWQGRDFLYKHLADEFWEVDESCMWLRETTRALHHVSNNIRRLELVLKKYGEILPSHKMGNALLEAKCLECGHRFGSKNIQKFCEKCNKDNIKQSFFAQKEIAKKQYVDLPAVSENARTWAKKYVNKNCVAVFARNRVAYGRNLDINFYKILLDKIKSKGCVPIWMGEKQSILNCPDENVLDFSKLPESKDLQYAIAVLERCDYSIQFWTASTRLSLEANCPYILIESPDQIYGAGQEGIRLDLLNKKNTPHIILLCNFDKCIESSFDFLDVVENSIDEVYKKEFGIKIGLVNDVDYVKSLMEKTNNDSCK